MGSALRLCLMPRIPTSLRVGASCGISILFSVLGGRSMGLLVADGSGLPKLTWQLALGLLAITGSCISWPTRIKWPVTIGLPLAVSITVYAVNEHSRFQDYSNLSPVSEWNEGTVGLISFSDLSEDRQYWFYILRTSFSVVINMTSILLILADVIWQQDMPKVFEDMAESDDHKAVDLSKKVRVMGTIIPALSMMGNVLGVTTQAASIETIVTVFAGGRTGLTSVITGTLFTVSMFIWPLHAVLAPGHVTGALGIIISISGSCLQRKKEHQAMMRYPVLVDHFQKKLTYLKTVQVIHHM
ncbi:unnamed protein product [Choristocarpus tenellus]